MSRLLKKGTKYPPRTLAVIVVSLIAVLALSPFFLPFATSGWEVSIGLDHIDYKSANTNGVFPLAGYGQRVDTDGLPRFNPYEVIPVGTDPQLYVRTSSGIRKVNLEGQTVTDPIETIGPIERDGVQYLYDLWLYEFQIDVQTLTAGRSTGAFTNWATETSEPVDFTVSVKLDITPWQYREGDKYGAGIMNAYLAPYLIMGDFIKSGTFPDTNPWEGKVDGAPERDFYQEEYIANALSSVNIEYVDEAEVSGDWADLTPDDKIPTQMLISVDGKLTAGAVHVGTLWIDNIYEVDAECYWNIVVEVLCIHGWDPEGGTAPPLWLEIEDIPPPPFNPLDLMLDFIQRIGEGLLEPTTFIIFVIAAVVAVVIIVLVVVVLYVPGAGRGLKGMAGRKNQGSKGKKK